NAGMGQATGRGQGGKRRFRPLDAQLLTAAGKGPCRAVEFVCTIRISRSSGPPWIGNGSSDLQCVLDFGVIVPHLAPVERPISAISEQTARLEPLRSKSQRNHGKMYGRSSDGLATVVTPHLKRVGAVDDTVIGPVQFRLLSLVRRE